MVKATPNSEAGVLPDEKMFAEMMAYNEKLVAAGIMKSGDGPASQLEGRARALRGQQAHRHRRPVLRDQGAGGRVLAVGVQVARRAIEWVKKCPNPMPGEDSDIEIRQIYAAEDFGDAFTPELQAKEQKIREQIERAS
jgi:hypothetical protein